MDQVSLVWETDQVSLDWETDQVSLVWETDQVSLDWEMDQGSLVWEMDQGSLVSLVGAAVPLRNRLLGDGPGGDRRDHSAEYRLTSCLASSAIRL